MPHTLTQTHTHTQTAGTDMNVFGLIATCKAQLHIQTDTSRQTESTTRAVEGGWWGVRDREGGIGLEGGQTFILLSRSLSLSSPSSSSFAVGVRVRTYACEPFGLTLRSHNSSINFHVLGPQLPLPHIRHGHAPRPHSVLGFGDCDCVALCAWTEEGVLLPKCCPLPSFLWARDSSTVVRNEIDYWKITNGQNRKLKTKTKSEYTVLKRESLSWSCGKSYIVNQLYRIITNF